MFGLNWVKYRHLYKKNILVCVCFFDESNYIEITWNKSHNEYMQICLDHAIPIERHLFE